MRSTRASAAVERLNDRCPGEQYSLVRGSDGLFHLVAVDEEGRQTRASDPMEQDDFVRFVDTLGPQTPQRVSKQDQEFEAQLQRNRRENGARNDATDR